MCVSVLKLRNLEVTSNLCHGADLLHPGMYNLQIPVEVMPATAADLSQLFSVVVQSLFWLPECANLLIKPLNPSDKSFEIKRGNTPIQRIQPMDLMA